MISIYYNGIVLKDCVVKRFQQSVVKDDSHTDVMYSRFVITVESTLVESQYQDVPLNVDPLAIANSFISVPAQNQNTVQSMDQVSRKLSEARKDFWMVCGGQTPGIEAEDFEDTLLIAAGELEIAGDPTIYRSPKYAGQGSASRFAVIDVENGPHVEDVAIEQIFGGKAMRVSATFKIARSLCLDYDDQKPVDDYTLMPDPGSGGEILNNRWSISESKDQNWVTTRRIEGTLRTRRAEFDAQLYRASVFPPLMLGYRRMSQNFVSDPTGTVLKYAIEDKQEYASAPAPAVDWDCTHTESTTAQGAVQAANFTIRLTGPQNVDKADLIATAGKVLSLRILDLQNLGLDTTHQTVLKEMAVIDQLHEPTIEMRASVLYTTSDDTWLNMRVRNMTGGRGGNLTGEDGIPGYNPVVWPKPLAYDSATPAGQLACYLQHPCSVWHGMPGIQQYQPRNERPEEVPAYPPDSYEYPYPEPLPDDTDAWTKNPYPAVEPKYDVQNYPYTLYQIATTWDCPQGRLHLPYSLKSADDAPGAVVSQVNNGLTRLFFEVEAIRTGLVPLIPAIHDEIVDDNDLTFKLLNWKTTLRPPEITADGNTKRYGLAMQLIYGADDLMPTDAILNPGALPFDVVPATDTNAQVSLTGSGDEEDRIIYSGTNTGSIA